MKSRGGREKRGEEGQVIILFALFLTVLTVLAALLYSGAGTLVLRRQLQNWGDAAALAAANIIPTGTTTATSTCTAARIASSGAGNDLYVAAKNYLVNNAGWTAAQVTARMTMACPSGYDSAAVTVNLAQTGPSWFGQGSLSVATASTAVNGQVSNGDYSVALLDKSNPTWTGHGGRTGCPSYLINGGVTVTYEGSVIVDSTCTLATNTSGSVKAQNSAFTMTMINNAKLITGGEVSAGTVSKITPAPTEDFRPLYADPLATMQEPCHATVGILGSSCLGTTGTTGTLPAQDYGTTGQGLCKNTKVACVLLPGTYSGGLLAANGSNASTLLLRPGVYFIEGGGVQLKSGAAQIISIPAKTGNCGGSIVGVCSDSDAITRYCNPTNNSNGSCQLTGDQVGTNWATDCPEPPTANTCGVLLYNAPKDNTAWATTGNSDAVANGSQGVILLRAYNPTYDTVTANGATSNGVIFAPYKNLVIWQQREPVPTDATTSQPTIDMHGGACVVMSGTMYAANGAVVFGGSTCGTGGGADAQLALQFICWDLTLAGNNNFYFKYSRAYFAKPYAYGLTQ